MNSGTQNGLKGLARTRWRAYLPILIVSALGVLASLFIGSDRYFQRILLLILLWAAASSAFNIISGYGGQIVFGYMMFEGTGAYTTVILFKFLGITPWLGMWVGVLIAVLVALVIGLPTLKLHGAYFAVATVAFPLLTIPILNHLGLEEVSIPFTGYGAGSMQFVDLRFYVLISVVLLAGILIIIRKIEHSRFGFYLRALKQNETASEGMGINTHKIKLLAFILSAALGSLVGTIYAFSILLVLTTHAIFGVFIIVRILSISIVGGLATVWGPVIGAAILVPIGEFLNAMVGGRYPGVQDIIYGAAMVAAIIYLPQGIWVKIRGVFPRLISQISIAKILPKAAATEASKPLQLAPIKHEILQDNTFEDILRVEDLDKSFGGIRPLVGVNFRVPQGKILGIIGPNGAGKTTLFNVINGYLKADKGRVFLEGKDITATKPHALCKLGIGRTFQVPQIFNDMTIMENILIGGFVKEITITKASRIASKIAEIMGLSSRSDDKAVGLTLWEIKMLELCRALATRPKLLLVDEPMAGLNPEESNRIGDVLRSIASSGITVIVIEHIVQSLVKIADRMVGLDEGRVVAEGLPEEVISDPHIIEAYLGTKWRQRYAESNGNNSGI